MARSRQSGGRRPDYDWTGVCGLYNNVDETNTLGSGTVVFNAAGTLVRIRGEIVVALDAPTDGDSKCVAMGLIIASDAAVAAGAASLPSPIGSIDAEWIWHQWCILNAETGTQTDQTGGQFARYVIDTKAMRKVKSNQQLVMLIDGQNNAGTPPAEGAYGIRALLAT